MQKIELKRKETEAEITEAYKRLRANIEFKGEQIKVIAVTSCAPHEGKSTVSFELASTFAQAGKRVLFVDGDLRQSELLQRHQKGKIRFGLVHYLIGKYSMDEVVCETDSKNLFMIFAGPVPPNPTELLGNQRFADMLVKAREKYDVVIVDTPPLGSVIDAAVVAGKCDGAILVIADGEVRYPLAQKIKEQLEKAGTRILGCVLNKAG